MTLDQALVRWDRLQSSKRHYNPHALAIYLQRADDVIDAVAKGSTLRVEIERGFSDRLRDFLLKNVDC